MTRQSGLQSLFSQQLDRALFATYFLGAVVPLLAGGYLVQQFALPAVEGDQLATGLILGATCGVAGLSLAAFFALRRLSLSAVANMKSDNARLAAILAVSRDLSDAPHLHAAAEIAAGCALRLSEADLVYLVRQPDDAKPLELCDSSGKGAQAYFMAHEEEILELAQTVCNDGSPTTGAVGKDPAVFLPMLAEGARPAAFAIIRHAGGQRKAAATSAQVMDALSTLASLAAVTIQSAELKDSQRNFFTHATEIMVMALDAHFGRRTLGGYHRIAQLANRIGHVLGIDDEETLRRIHFASLLSDIGMLKLPAGAKPGSTQAAQHAVHGHRILSRIRIWEPLAEIVLTHHDPYDAGQNAERAGHSAAPFEARIIHVADEYARLTHAVADGTQRTPSGAVECIQAEAGTRFDPRVVTALANLLEQGVLDEAS